MRGNGRVGAFSLLLLCSTANSGSHISAKVTNCRKNGRHAHESIRQENKETEGGRIVRNNDLRQDFDFMMKECRTVFWENNLDRLNRSKP
jgi:hypothetical protein